MTARRISTPVVLASASAMVAIGISAWLISSPPEGEAGSGQGASTEQSAEDEAPVARVPIRNGSIEAVCETFYEAWRKRQWDVALAVSRADARVAVVQRRAADAAMDGEERAVALRMWRVLAQAPLNLLLNESEELGGGRVTVRGIAEYDLLGQPYRRRVEFDVAPDSGHFIVERMGLGEVLTDLPRVFRMDAPLDEAAEDHSQ